MAYDQIITIVIVGIILSIYFYIMDCRETPEIIEFESRLDFLIGKFKQVMSKNDEQDLKVVISMLRDRDNKLEERDNRMEKKVDDLTTTVGNLAIKVTETQGDVRQLQFGFTQLTDDFKELKATHGSRPPDNERKAVKTDKNNSLLITNNKLQINVNWKVLRAVLYGFGTAIGGGGAVWLWFEKFMMGGN